MWLFLVEKKNSACGNVPTSQGLPEIWDLFSCEKKSACGNVPTSSGLPAIWPPWDSGRKARFSNGLAYNRSKVSVKKSQIGFIVIIFLRSIFPYMSNIYENGQMRRFAFQENLVYHSDCLSKHMIFGLKWVYMARYELILRLDGALWLTIISKTPLTPRKAMEGPKNPKESKMAPGTGGNPCTRTNETQPYANSMQQMQRSRYGL